jgi:hypothetical protein
LALENVARETAGDDVDAIVGEALDAIVSEALESSPASTQRVNTAGDDAVSRIATRTESPVEASGAGASGNVRGGRFVFGGDADGRLLRHDRRRRRVPPHARERESKTVRWRGMRISPARDGRRS